MSYEDHAAGVAADYQDALEGLTMNSRVEINTLTVIARENTEYAYAISEVLQEHIKKVPPSKKLPALYLLDSIVKNVGTPYTIYFSRGLYTTFMDAYASVDNQVRRKMDEMLKTWKEPVPGSADPRPVFPPDVVRPIENALLKARASALQAQKEHMRAEQQLLGNSRGRPHGAAPPYRETPTPPGGRQGPYPPTSSAAAGLYGQRPPAVANGMPYGVETPLVQQPPAYSIHTAQVPARSTPQPTPSAPAAFPYQPPPAQLPHGPLAAAAVPGISIDSLNYDIERLINASKGELAERPYDTSIAAKLKALLDLQTLLKSQNLAPDKLMLVKNQIDALSVNMAAAQSHTPTPPVAGPYHPPPSLPLTISSIPQPVAAPAPAPPPAAAPIGAPVSAPPVPLSLDALLGKGALATLLARQAITPQVPVPSIPSQQQQQAVFPPPRQASSLPPAQPPAGPLLTTPGAATPDPMALLGLLRKAGVVPATGGAAPGAPSGTPPMLAPTPVSLTSSLPGVISAVNPGAPRPPLQEVHGDIVLKAASLKVFRPHLLPLLYQALGPPCTQCGRRFKTDEAGRARKTAHMDWHFRVHQRIAEAEKRGQHRSWYVDQMDWIQSREVIDADHVEPPVGSSGSGSGAGAASGADAGSSAARGGSAAPKPSWIPVPEGAGADTVCPICQERFEVRWLDEAQEWVWVDAVRIGGRAYHASCHAEATRDRGVGGAGAGAGGGASEDEKRLHGHGGGVYARNTPEPVLGKRKAEGDHTWRGKGKAEKTAGGESSDAKVDLNALPY